MAKEYHHCDAVWYAIVGIGYLFTMGIFFNWVHGTSSAGFEYIGVPLFIIITIGIIGEIYKITCRRVGG